MRMLTIYMTMHMDMTMPIVIHVITRITHLYDYYNSNNGSNKPYMIITMMPAME